MKKRLIKVARELNVGTRSIIDFLTEKGFEVENKPTSVLSKKMYNMLLIEFKGSLGMHKSNSMFKGSNSEIKPKRTAQLIIGEGMKKIEKLHEELNILNNTFTDLKKILAEKDSEIEALKKQVSPEFPFPEIDMKITRSTNKDTHGNINWGKFGDGLLSISGYRVGKTNGVKESERRKILNYIFLKDMLDDIQDNEYKKEWGEPKSSKRLQKLINVIATLGNNALRKKGDYSQAIWHWHDDLQYLKENFYNKWGDFPWPAFEPE